MVDLGREFPMSVGNQPSVVYTTDLWWAEMSNLYEIGSMKNKGLIPTLLDWLKVH